MIEVKIKDLCSNRKYFDMFFTLPEEYEVFFSPFRSTNKPTCSFINSDNYWEIYDYESRESYDVLDAVMELHKINLKEAENLIRKEVKNK